MPYWQNKKKYLVLCLLVVLAAGFAYAKPQDEEDNALLDNIIGSTFKTLAKAFLFASDLPEIKKENIAKLRKMDDGKFKSRYSKIYDITKDYPLFSFDYGLSQNLSKVEAIEKIGALDKQKIYEIIDSLPNTFIAGQFRSYFDQKRQEILKSNISLQIQQLWNKIISGVNKR